VLTLAGRTWAASGDPTRGEAFLKRAVEADPSNLEAYSLLASLYIHQKRTDDAVHELDRLSALQPGAVGPPTLAALICQARGQAGEAQRRFERLVEAHPEAAVASNNLAWMYASRGEQLDRALELAQAAKAGLPDDPQVNDTLGYVYIRKQLSALAIAPLTLAVERQPTNAVFHYHLGMAYAASGNRPAARQSLERALALKSVFDGADDARSLLRSLDQER
jgi:Flp pilus assembly protein TadD